MENLRELMFSQRRDQNVNMIGRHDEFIKVVALPVKMSEGVFHNLFHFRQSQDTRAGSSIEPLLQALRKALVIFLSRHRIVGLRMLRQPLVSLRPPLRQLFLRQRVGETEGHEVRRTVLPPVGKISRKKRQRLTWVEII